MNSECTLIQTDKSAAYILKLILGEDKTFAPMGSGGYKIKEEKGHEGNFLLVSFVVQGRTPDGNHFSFLKDGEIWATYMGPWIARLLCEAGISFSSRRVKNPDFIEQEMTKKLAV